MIENQFTKAIVCPPAETFADGLTSVSLGVPDLERAQRQHAGYCKALSDAGLQIVTLSPDRVHPDSTFVEDTAMLTPKWAIITRPGAESRVGEIERITRALSQYFGQLERIEPPGTVDGGDICEIGDHYLIGVSARTNTAGSHQLSRILAEQGCTSNEVDIRGRTDILHLKSGITYLGNDRLLVIKSLADNISVPGTEILIVPEGDEYAANCIRVNDRLLIPAGFPRTRAMLDDLGYTTVQLDMSEFQKMDGGLSCLSLRF